MFLHVSLHSFVNIWYINYDLMSDINFVIKTHAVQFGCFSQIRIGRKENEKYPVA